MTPSEQEYYRYLYEEGLSYEETETEETIYDVWNNCVVESFNSIHPLLLKLILSNLLFGICVNTGFLNEARYHLLSGCTGLYLLHTLESWQVRSLVIGCSIVGYFLYILNNIFCQCSGQNFSHVIKVILIVCLILSEYLLVQPDIWMQIRGIIMILSMKIISLCDDFTKSQKSLSLLQYFGFTSCGANILFGPWISYNDYYSLHVNPTRKNGRWLLNIVRAVLISIFCLTISNCWSTYFIPEGYNRWLVAYREALSFRTSHYFICYLSEASMLAAGFKDRKLWQNGNKWTYTITNPLEIEFPTALATVVTNWNRPMHEFLKKYVYRSWLPQGQFAAIFATFVISSFLHGLELKVSVVLITIGVFSYLQMKPRRMVADVTSCCVGVKPCNVCDHRYKRNHVRTRLINLIYMFSTMLHLAYLGILMDSSTDQIGIYRKWKNLYFISHLVMSINLLLII